MIRTGVPTVDDLVRVANTHPTWPARVGILRSRHITGYVHVRWLDGKTSLRIPEYDVMLERVENLSDEEVAALMRAKLKGQV